MLRVLALRQSLLALNAALGILFLLLVVLISRQALRPEINPTGFSAVPGVSEGDGLKLAKVRDMSAYAAIANGKLFGDAGAFEPGKQAAAPPPPPPSDEAEETKLPLTLFGTSLSEGPNPRAAAIIDVRGGSDSGTKTFYLGDEVMENVLLQEVHAASVILDNRRQNRLESLQIDWNTDGTVSLTRARTLPAAAATINRPNLITLNRADITKKVEEEYARVASSLNVKVVTGSDGNVKGITTDDIEKYDVARELGFKNGDVLVSVNNEPVRSREDAVNVVKKYQNASIFRVGILRGGQMQYITYRVR